MDMNGIPLGFAGGNRIPHWYSQLNLLSETSKLANIWQEVLSDANPECN